MANEPSMGKRQKNHRMQMAVKQHLLDINLDVKCNEMISFHPSVSNSILASSMLTCLQPPETGASTSGRRSSLGLGVLERPHTIAEPEHEYLTNMESGSGMEENDINSDTVSEDLDWNNEQERNLRLYISDSDVEDLNCQYEHEPEAKNIRTFLCKWYHENNIPQVALTSLLKGLHQWHEDLPLDARTLLQTPRITDFQTMGAGSYRNFGLKDSIIKHLDNFKINCSTLDHLHLNLNVDGLPLYKSSNIQFWPILCIIEEDKHRKPFPISLFCGPTKPPIDQFLHDFVNDFSCLEESGLVYGKKTLQISVRAFCCDTPAKAFVKCVKSHNAYYGCDRCIQRGEWVGRMTFPDNNAPLRTDESFKKLENSSHHKAVSPLVNLNMGLISCFPLDYMHLICLGVMRRLLLQWKQGNRAVRVSYKDIHYLSSCLLNAQMFWPVDFNRQPRSLTELDRWKATEFRQFLCYLGPVYLKQILPKQIYCNFMLLFCAINILVDQDLHLKFNRYADSLLKLFITNAAELYGREILVYNIHSLTHLANDVQNFGPLDSFSAFPFENYLGMLKRMLRKPNNPLQQVCNRLAERESAGLVRQSYRRVSSFKVVESSRLNHTNWPNKGINGTHFTKIDGPYHLSANNRDSCVFLTSGSILKINHFILDKSGVIHVIGKKFSRPTDFFNYPCKSSTLSIYRVKNLSNDFYAYNLDSIKRKAVILPLNTDFICLPMHHVESRYT